MSYYQQNQNPNSYYDIPPNRYHQSYPPLAGFNLPPPSQYPEYPDFRDGYAPSYHPPPSQLSEVVYSPPSGPPPQAGYSAQLGPLSSFSSYSANPYSSQYSAAYQQQSQIIHYLNTPVPAPVGYDLPPQGDIAPGYDPTMDTDKIRKATKGFGTDETALIAVLAHLPSLPMAKMSGNFKARTGKSLVEVLKSETSGYFGATLRGLALGPLWYDVELAREAIQGVGTNELLLTEIIADRTVLDRQNLFIAYRMRYGRDLQADIRSDLSAKTERMFTMILSANTLPENVPVDPQSVESDVHALYKAGQGKIGTDEIVFCDIIINRSRLHLTALCDAYGRKYKSLSKVIKSEFSGHMRDTLLFIIQGAKSKHAMEGPGVWRDAKLLERTMKGLGTKDKQLVRRLLRYHWDRPRFEAIKAAYHKKFKKSLEGRVAGETSGDYKKLLVEIVKGA